ncbi:MAG: ABC transporter permease [Ruminococcus sp.]|jgi:peptide/nickel transport system permease protein
MKKNMKKRKALMFRLLFYGAGVGLLIFLAFFGEMIAPYDPYEIDMMAINQPPSSQFLFGTDNLGRDILSRILAGTRSSVFAMLLITSMAMLIGTLLGLLGGYYGGVFDIILQKILLIFQSFPGLVMAIAVAGVLGAGLRNAVIALITVGWTAYARLARSLVLKIRESNYIKAAKLCGCGSIPIIFHHVIPNISSSVFVYAMVSLSGVILEISSLSFLGLSAKPPVPEWGFMMNEGRKVLLAAPWQALVPGIAILITVIIFNRFGDSVQDFLEVRENMK